MAFSPNIREGTKYIMEKKYTNHRGKVGSASQGRQGAKKRPMRLTQQDKYNGSGCLDMTAYLAMRNIERRGG